MLKRTLFRALLGIFAVVGVFAGYIPVASAALSGSCGMVVSIPHNHVLGTMSGNVNMGTGAFNSNFQMEGPGSTQGVNLLAVINFTTSTINFNVTQVTIGTPNSYATQSGSAIFTTAAGPLTGSYMITFTPPGSTTLNLILLPVNSGNTMLVQGTSGNAGALVGVCQAL